MKAKLSSCIIQKFNGYDLLRVELALDERKNLLPVDIVYEPTQCKTKPIYCYFAPKIHLEFQSVYESFKNGKKISLNLFKATCHFQFTTISRLQQEVRYSLMQKCM